MEFMMKRTLPMNSDPGQNVLLPFTVGLFDLIDEYERLERLCEAALGRQDELARILYNRPAPGSEVQNDYVEVKSGQMVHRSAMTVRDIPFKDFRALNRLAQSVVPIGLPSASKRFVVNACTPEFVEIEAAEAEVRSLRAHMTALEEKILDAAPETASEAVAKLKFVSSLMLDGGECEIDLFSYLVEECAFVIGEELHIA